MENSSSDQALEEGACAKPNKVAEDGCESKDTDEVPPTIRDEEAPNEDARAKTSSPAVDPDGEMAAGANSKKRKKVRTGRTLSPTTRQLGVRRQQGRGVGACVRA
jgi:hypothetical protein